MVRTSLEKCSTFPPMVGTFRVFSPLNVPTIEAPRGQKGNEKFSCFVIGVEKIMSHLLGAKYPMYCIRYIGPIWIEMDGWIRDQKCTFTDICKFGSLLTITILDWEFHCGRALIYV